MLLNTWGYISNVLVKSGVYIWTLSHRLDTLNLCSSPDICIRKRCFCWYMSQHSDTGCWYTCRCLALINGKTVLCLMEYNKWYVWTRIWLNRRMLCSMWPALHKLFCKLSVSTLLIVVLTTLETTKLASYDISPFVPSTETMWRNHRCWNIAKIFMIISY